MPQYSNKVTSDMQPQNAKLEPISGRGRYRQQGQKIGEIDRLSLISQIAGINI